MSLFDDRDIAAITAPDFPRGRTHKRGDLLKAGERDLTPVAAVRRKRESLRGRAEIGLAVGVVIDRHKMAKHPALDIIDTASPSSCSLPRPHSTGSTPCACAPACRTRAR